VIGPFEILSPEPTDVLKRPCLLRSGAKLLMCSRDLSFQVVVMVEGTDLLPLWRTNVNFWARDWPPKIRLTTGMCERRSPSDCCL